MISQVRTEMRQSLIAYMAVFFYDKAHIVYKIAYPPVICNPGPHGAVDNIKGSGDRTGSPKPSLFPCSIQVAPRGGGVTPYILYGTDVPLE